MAQARAALHRLVDTVADDHLPALARFLEAFQADGGLTSAPESELVQDAAERDARFGDDLGAEAASLTGSRRPWRPNGAP